MMKAEATSSTRSSPYFNAPSVFHKSVAPTHKMAVHP